MMLVRSSFDADHGKQEILCVWIPGEGSTLSDQQNAVPKTKDDSLCSQNFLTSSQLSTEINMSETSIPKFVYKRKMIRRNPVLPLSQSCTPTLVYKRRKVIQTVFPSQISTNTRESDNGVVIEGQNSKLQSCSELRAVNESCSSSKLNLDLGSASGECSSSGVLILEGLGKDEISETNSCVSFLQRHGVVISTKKSRSTKPVGGKKGICCLRLCKVCGRSSATLEMLICDLCEESFHVSCCNPVIKKVPVGDWFCHSCLRKKLKKMKETSCSKSPKDYSGPIASILRDVGPYTTNVRIGKDFQAEIPDWFGPITRDLNDYSEPVELSPLDCASYQDLGSSKLSKLSPIGNWLQCREVVDGVDGTVCGKWRRAPLFEVQTDDWECFCSVLWDPTHADCAVPQELDTDQVLKQLKYIEMLRPRLSVKRWKLGVNKGIENTKNTPKS